MTDQKNSPIARARFKMIKLQQHILILIAISMTTVVVYQIVARIGGFSVRWTEELARFLNMGNFSSSTNSHSVWKTDKYRFFLYGNAYLASAFDFLSPNFDLYSCISNPYLDRFCTSTGNLASDQPRSALAYGSFYIACSGLFNS